MTLEPTTCAVVPGAQLRDFIVTHPDFALHLIHNLIHRLRTLTGTTKSLALEDVYSRVVGLLQRLSVPEGEQRVLLQRMTQQDIAERVGSSREMVSRIFKELTVGGYVRVAQRTHHYPEDAAGRLVMPGGFSVLSSTLTANTSTAAALPFNGTAPSAFDGHRESSARRGWRRRSGSRAAPPWCAPRAAPPG